MESILENKLITSYKNEMISFLKSHPEYFDEAIQLAVSDKQPYSWRAAYLLWGCMDNNDSRIRNYISLILNSIKDKKDGHQRELLKILYKMEISKKYEGKIFDICFNLWEQLNKDPSVRMTAFKFIIKIVKKHPELMEEIIFLTQDHYLETLSPGVKHSIEKLMKEVLPAKQNNDE
ncbi:MAG: hypothetical protein A2068_05325 [Ignavibacteria bacterium GWB2_35_6b]|nr:MAG: hypothetical protein A2068_05325 [Ignavibacteria bacterium GWB2_35_6b]